MVKFREEYNKLMRNYELKRITGNLGNVVEEDDKIVCFLFKFNSENEVIDLLNYDSIKRNKKHGISKPIYYVLDGINFDDETKIIGHDGVNVIINNCKLPHCIMIDGNCQINNCNYKSSMECNISAGDLKLKDCEINSRGFLRVVGLTNLQVLNTSINNYGGNIILHSLNNILFDSSRVYSSIVLSFLSLEISSNNSTFASSKVEIISDYFNTLDITAGSVECNGKLVGRGRIGVSRENTPLSTERQKLIAVLNNIYNKCDTTREEILRRVSSDVYNSSISRVLNKK